MMYLLRGSNLKVTMLCYRPPWSISLLYQLNINEFQLSLKAKEYGRQINLAKLHVYLLMKTLEKDALKE